MSSPDTDHANAIIANLSDGLLAFDRDCRYIEWNPAMERISGMKAADCIGRNAFEVFPFLKEIGEDKYFDAALSGQSVLTEKRSFHVPESGRSGYFEAHYSPMFDARGEVIGGTAVVRDITDRTLMEQRRAEAIAEEKGEERFRALVDLLPHIIWTADSQGRNQFTNRYSLDFLGLKEGTTEMDEWLHRIHPDDRELVDGTWRRGFEKQESFESQHRLKRASDGAYRWFLSRGFPVKNKQGEVIQWIGAATDIHEYAVASRRSMQLQWITAALSSAITPEQVADIVLSQGLAALGAKNGVVTVLSEDRGNLEIIAHKGYGADVTGQWRQIPMSAAIPLTESIRCRRLEYVGSLDDANRRYPLMAGPMKASGESAFAALPLIIANNAIGALGISFAEPKAIDEENERFMQTLAGLCSHAFARSRIYASERAARASAESANAAKNHFLATVSHELRTPLSSIVGYADLLANPQLPEEKRASFVDKISRNGKILTRLINDILDLSKIEAGHLTMELTEVNLGPFLHELVEHLKAEAESKGIVFKFTQKPDAPANVVSDPLRLRQILFNVCSNAIKFTDSGSVSLTLEGGAAGELVFRVEDTGAGIKPGAHDLLFRPFSQGHSNMTRKLAGTGLGLVIARQLARLLGGDVTLIASAPGRGSIFEIRIIPSRQPPPRNGRQHESPAPGRNCLAGLKILIVDDAWDVQTILSSLLESQGAKAEIAANGEDAVSRAPRADFDVVIMDIEMPLMDGYAAAARLRQSGFTKPMIAITANALADPRSSIQSGFNAHMVKPIDNRKLLETILRAVAHA
jgi:PAS domain S-box-containing protein